MPKKGTKAKTKENKAKKVEEPEIKEQVTEEPVPTEEVQEEPSETTTTEEKPKLNKSERAQLRAELYKQDVIEHLEAEEEKFTSIVCEACGTNLEVDPDVHMMTGIQTSEKTCPNKDCQRLTMVTSRYDGPPEEFNEASIVQTIRGPIWFEVPVPDLEDDQVINLISYHADMIKEGSNNQVTEVEAAIIKNLDIINRSLGLREVK